MEPTYQEALHILWQARFEECTAAANARNKLNTFAVYLYPGGMGVSYCDDEQEVIDLAVSVMAIEEERVPVEHDQRLRMEIKNGHLTFTLDGKEHVYNDEQARSIYATLTSLPADRLQGATWVQLPLPPDGEEGIRISGESAVLLRALLRTHLEG